MAIGLLALHGIAGLLLIGHGAQKLFGAFGGNGIAGTAAFFEQNLGLRPGRLHALAGGGAEVLGGALIALGLFTPVGAALGVGVIGGLGAIASSRLAARGEGRGTHPQAA